MKRDIFNTVKGVWILGTLYLIAYFLGHWSTGGHLSDKLDETPLINDYVMVPLFGFGLEMLIAIFLNFAHKIGQSLPSARKPRGPHS